MLEVVTAVGTAAGPVDQISVLQHSGRIIVILGALLAGSQLAARDKPPMRSSTEAHRHDFASANSSAPGSPVRLPISSRLNGLAIQLHGGMNIFEEYHRLIPEVAELGADTVLFVVHGWQTHAGSLDLHIDEERSAHPDGLGQLLDLAAMHGLRRILMPVVLLKQPRNGEWRGKIVPPGHNWDEWFRRYRMFVGRYADIAEQHGVEMFMVGSELIKTESYTGRWREVIADVRSRYRGKLGYSANWDHYQTSKIGFWPELDYVGMTSYYELAKKSRPKIDEIDENWERIKKNILAFQREVQKPIIFTEVGWCSQEGAAHEGWNYYANPKATEEGHREQAILYQSFLRNWTDVPGVGGIIFWEWTTCRGGKDDYNYTPRGKLAETILRLWFANEREKTQSEVKAAEATTTKPAG